MAQTFSEGEIINYTATGAILNGQIKVINRLAGVALVGATGAGIVCPIALTGVFDVAAVATGAKTIGNRVFYRTTGSTLKAVFASGTATGSKYIIGTVWQTATAAATTCKIKLTGAPLSAIT